MPLFEDEIREMAIRTADTHAAQKLYGDISISGVLNP